MSTILKALEKLEREKEALKATGPIPVLSATSPARSGPAGWFLKPWLLWGLVGFIIVALGCTAWYFYRQSRVYGPRLAERSGTIDRKPDRRPGDAHDQAAAPHIPDAARPESRRPDQSLLPQEAKAGSQPAVHQARPRANRGDGRIPRPEETSASGDSGPLPVRETPAVPKPTRAESPAGRPNRAIQRQTPEEAPAAEIPAATGETGKVEEAPAAEIPAAMGQTEKVEEAPVESPQQPDSASEGNAPSDVYEHTPLLTDGRLRVHAIACSPQPEERMAVINNRVVHEGDSVEDFMVILIRPDDVVVREKEKGVWRVEFGRP